MKYLPLLCLAALFSLSSLAQPLRVATFNIRYDNPGDGANQWKNRQGSLVRQIRDVNPDLMGLQESLHNQTVWLDSVFSDYDREGVGRDDGATGGEYCPIFFKKDRFQRIDGGTFWLSPTPEKASKGWDAALNRICTWLKLNDKYTGATLLALNTHFDHMGQTARRQSARLLADTIVKMAEPGTTLILTGDFNAPPDSEPITLLATALTDTRTGAENGSPLPMATFNGWNEGDDNRCIDFIFVGKKTKVNSYRVHNYRTDGRLTSDHYMVTSEIVP